MSQEESVLNGVLSQTDCDTVSEITNIAMGAAGSTLAVLLGQDVEINVSGVNEYATLDAMPSPLGEDPRSLVAIQYVKGIQASTAFVLKNSDAAKLSEMMLGMPTEGGTDVLNELQVGGISELMNQMMNSAATSLASVIHQAVEISNPEVLVYSADNLQQCLPKLSSEPFVCIRLDIKIGTDAPIDMVQLVSVSEAQSQINQFLSVEPDAAESGMGTVVTEDLGAAGPDDDLAMSASAARSGGQATGASAGARMNVDPVTVRPVAFSSFDNQTNVFGEENKNLELVMDVALNLTVELGKTELSIKEVLELTRGSVIELDRVAGEPVDLMANGKLIAKGEVVVIEDNFGLRITSIVSPADRLRGL